MPITNDQSIERMYRVPITDAMRSLLNEMAETVLDPRSDWGRQIAQFRELYQPSAVEQELLAVEVSPGIDVFVDIRTTREQATLLAFTEGTITYLILRSVGAEVISQNGNLYNVTCFRKIGHLRAQEQTLRLDDNMQVWRVLTLRDGDAADENEGKNITFLSRTVVDRA